MDNRVSWDAPKGILLNHQVFLFTYYLDYLIISSTVPNFSRKQLCKTLFMNNNIFNALPYFCSYWPLKWLHTSVPEVQQSRTTIMQILRGLCQAGWPANEEIHSFDAGVLEKGFKNCKIVALEAWTWAHSSNRLDWIAHIYTLKPRSVGNMGLSALSKVTLSCFRRNSNPQLSYSKAAILPIVCLKLCSSFISVLNFKKSKSLYDNIL